MKEKKFYEQGAFIGIIQNWKKIFDVLWNMDWMYLEENGNQELSVY